MNSTRGGSLYIGIDDAGNPVGVDGIDKAMLEIKDRIKNNNSPSTVGLFEISSDAKDRFIQICICSGNQKPYYMRKYGVCPELCYLRIGTSVGKMNEETILSLFQKRDKRTLKSIPSPEDKLTFSFLRNAYKRRGSRCPTILKGI